MKKIERIVKLDEQIYCSIFGLICKKCTYDRILHYREVYLEKVDEELIKKIKMKL